MGVLLCIFWTIRRLNVMGLLHTWLPLQATARSALLEDAAADVTPSTRGATHSRTWRGRNDTKVRAHKSSIEAARTVPVDPHGPLRVCCAASHHAELFIEMLEC